MGNEPGLSEELKIYIANLISPLATSEDLKKTLDEFKTNLAEEVSKLEKRLNEKDHSKKNQQTQIDILESKIAIMENTLAYTSLQADNTEQYTRRQSVRIHGISVEDNENLIDKVRECHEEVGEEFKLEDIDRVHRIGKKIYDVKKKKHIQPIIVKFRNWDARTRFYEARPRFVKQQEGKQKPGPRKFSVSVDLTKRRLELLKYARGMIDSGNYDIKFAFADVNCSLGLRFNDGNIQFFNSKQELHHLLEINGDDQS